MQIGGEVLKIFSEYGTLGGEKINIDLNKVTTLSFEAP
jgi:hypothetical protein